MSRLRKNLALALEEELTKRQMEFVQMHYLQGMSLTQVANTVGVSVPTVSRTLDRARRRLYRCLRYGAKSLLSRENEM
jgi:RNA polymerase sigma-70 factor (ECF subfamily)